MGVDIDHVNRLIRRFPCRLTPLLYPTLLHPYHHHPHRRRVAGLGVQAAVGKGVRADGRRRFRAREEREGRRDAWVVRPPKGLDWIRGGRQAAGSISSGRSITDESSTMPKARAFVRVQFQVREYVSNCRLARPHHIIHVDSSTQASINQPAIPHTYIHRWRRPWATGSPST